MPRLLRRLSTGLVTAVALALAAVMLLPAAFGYDRYVIVSDSMTGTYDRGSIVYAKAVPTDALRVGDAITYAPPPGFVPHELVTHRIVGAKVVDGERVFRTKGDAVPTADPWTFMLPESTQARVDFSVPYAGFVIAALADRETRMLVIGLPALLIALSVLVGLAREWRRERAAQAPPSSVWVRL